MEAGTTTTDNGPSGPRPMKRRALRIDADSLVTKGSHPDAGGPMPLVVQPAMDGVDLAAWASEHRDEIINDTLIHGAVLFHNFQRSTPALFGSVAQAICPDLFGEYGDLPKEDSAANIYKSTPYPSDKTILFHNESSHLPTFPLKQFFGCVVASPTGGETPLLDCRRIYQEMDPSIRHQFETKGLRYTRTFAEGLDVSWEDFFKTRDRSEVERRCAAEGMTCEWTSRGYLRVASVVPAVEVHPVTGETSFFNQVQLHHVSCLDADTRQAMLALFDLADLPRNVYFGDGSEIPDDTMAHLGSLFDQHAVALPWTAGDMLMLDNIIVSHGRRPFTGDRKIVVALAQMQHRDGARVSASA